MLLTNVLLAIARRLFGHESEADVEALVAGQHGRNTGRSHRPVRF